MYTLYTSNDGIYKTLVLLYSPINPQGVYLIFEVFRGIFIRGIDKRGVFITKIQKSFFYVHKIWMFASHHVFVVYKETHSPIFSLIFSPIFSLIFSSDIVCRCFWYYFDAHTLKNIFDSMFISAGGHFGGIFGAYFLYSSIS